jgi:hypothetical protein
MDRSFFPSYYQFIDTPDIADETLAGNTPSVTYLGYWQTGTLGADPLAQANWKIKRVTIDNLITKTEYAQGSQAFNKIWNDRTTYNYSFEK